MVGRIITNTLIDAIISSIDEDKFYSVQDLLDLGCTSEVIRYFERIIQLNMNLTMFDMIEGNAVIAMLSSDVVLLIHKQRFLSLVITSQGTVVMYGYVPMAYNLEAIVPYENYYNILTNVIISKGTDEKYIPVV